MRKVFKIGERKPMTQQETIKQVFEDNASFHNADIPMLMSLSEFDTAVAELLEMQRNSSLNAVYKTEPNVFLRDKFKSAILNAKIGE